MKQALFCPRMARKARGKPHNDLQRRSMSGSGLCARGTRATSRRIFDERLRQHGSGADRERMEFAAEASDGGGSVGPDAAPHEIAESPRRRKCGPVLLPYSCRRFVSVTSSVVLFLPNCERVLV